jgi:phage terminase large subunit
MAKRLPTLPNSLVIKTSDKGSALHSAVFGAPVAPPDTSGGGSAGGPPGAGRNRRRGRENGQAPALERFLTPPPPGPPKPPTPRPTVPPLPEPPIFYGEPPLPDKMTPDEQYALFRDPFGAPVGPPPAPPPPPSAEPAATPPPAPTHPAPRPTGPPNDFVAFVQKYRADPVGFVRQVLKADPTEDQEQFLQAIARGDRRISIRAGHGVGKSTVCSWAMLWHMLTRFPQKCVCTAPTAGQLYDALFAELKRWITELPPFLSSLLDVKSESIELKAAPDASFISARTSSKDTPEALAGIHSDHVLLIVDEASAVPEPIFESAIGSMSGHSATTVLISNPTRNSGQFYKTHHELASEWTTFHWSCLKSRLVNPDFVKQVADTYGEESNAYRVRVLGEFALRDDDVLIPAELVDAAMVRDVIPDPKATLVYGLDVARFGDDRSVLCKRKGNVVLELKVWKNLDLMQLVGAVMNEADTDKPDEILVDSIGIGAGVADRLRELGQPARDINVSESAAMNPKANRLRDDLWMAARDFFRERAGKIPNDPVLRQELVSPRYTFTSTGKLQVEGKADMKKRGLKSPDLADAFCLTFGSAAMRVGGRWSKWRSGEPLKRKIKGVV